MSFIPLQPVRFPLLNFLLTHTQQTNLYNTYIASINAESAERLKYVKEEHQQRMQYAKEEHHTRERYMKEEHDAKMRILDDAGRHAEIEKKKGAEERDEMEVDDAKQTLEVREQDDERDGEPAKKRQRPNANNSK
jgi:hypothetical protein